MQISFDVSIEYVTVNLTGQCQKTIWLLHVTCCVILGPDRLQIQDLDLQCSKNLIFVILLCQKIVY